MRIPGLRLPAALVLLSILVGNATAAPNDLFPPGKLAPWEREVERARKRQDREVSSCRARNQPIGNILRRYKQQVIKAPTALNYYLYGRILADAKKADEALRMMRRALEVSPHLWYADWALAVFFLNKKRYTDALFHLDLVRRKKPDHPQIDALAIQIHMEQKQWREAYDIARRMLAQNPHDWQVRRVIAVCLLQLEQWELAVPQLRALVRKFPKDLGLRRGLIDCLLNLEQWAKAVAELEQFKRLVPKDPLTLWQLGLASFQAGSAAAEGSPERERWFRAAVVELEALDALKPGVMHVLDLLQNLYARLKMPDKLLAVWKRMLPLIDDPEARKQLEEMIKRVEEGGPAPEGAPGWKRNPLAELLERCVHPDPAIRRDALHEYLEADLPFVDPVVYRRYDPQVEPDAECRLLVVRILGTYRQGDADAKVVRSVSRYVALALEDPEARVRRVAAEELGRIGAKTGILYLLPQFTSLRLAPVPEDPDARAAIESEYNACRLALITLAGRSDVEVGEANWIPAENMQKNREAWRRWLDGPAGVAVRLAALQELRAVDDVEPRWHLRYILVDVLRAEPSPSGIALESYRVLRDAVLALGDKAGQDPWWKTFPNIPDADVTGEKLPQLRETLKAWWGSLPRKAPAPAPGEERK